MLAHLKTVFINHPVACTLVTGMGGDNDYYLEMVASSVDQAHWEGVRGWPMAFIGIVCCLEINMTLQLCSYLDCDSLTSFISIYDCCQHMFNIQIIWLLACWTTQLFGGIWWGSLLDEKYCDDHNDNGISVGWIRSLEWWLWKLANIIQLCTRMLSP